MDKKIYITVDTECHNINKINEYIYGETKKGKYGLEKILQLGQELKIPINFFLDIPECHKYGDEHIQKLVDLIDKYKQPIFLHIHPDYIADKNRKHLWEYTEEEQKDIIKTSIGDYSRFCGDHKKIVLRAGAWGVNDTTYKVLQELLPKEKYEVIDLSYLYKSNWRCHLSYEECGVANVARIYRDITLFPNTTYIGFDYFGRVMTSSLNVPNPNFGLFKKIIRNNSLHNITFTMHSWDFIKKWFFLPNYIAEDKYIIKKFKKCVSYARKHGYKFEDLNNYTIVDESDQIQNICRGAVGKLVCIWYQYRSFAMIGRSYSKYALLYFAPFILAIFIITICLLLI